MKISRSKAIKIVCLLILFIGIFIFNFIKNKKDKDELYAYNDKEEPKEVENTSLEVVDVEKVEMEVREIVYDNMTLEELSSKLEKSLNDNLSGYGNFIASYALEKGIDPYLATAIMLHETGCTWGCSSLVKKCNNVGGMKGSGCGQYGYFDSLETGIQKFIDNIYKNYYAYGLTNAKLMGKKYAEDPEWSNKVDRHIEKIKNR